MLNTSADVLCELSLFYHADYYRSTVIAFDYECCQHHASFHVYVRMGSEPGIPPSAPPPPHTHSQTNQWRRPMTHKEKKWRKGENRGGRLKKQTSEVIGLYATEVKKQTKRKRRPNPSTTTTTTQKRRKAPQNDKKQQKNKNKKKQQKKKNNSKLIKIKRRKSSPLCFITLIIIELL